ncbi:hypothetical protein [Sorangium sp. So ce1099]|uniref:Cap15 family cyclic dinucleotide receptor domain-containing protein n=1 Tax=Sorangium sp. So ce1099 TaxID=3133331 RepID=UPI003F61054C
MTGWHPYAHSLQRAATVWLAVLGVAAAWAWGAATRAFNWDVPWWLDTPAVFGFYGVLYWAYDRLLWRLPPFRALHGIPNLSGRYKVTIRTSHDGHATSREALASVAQSWSRIVLRLETDSSTSISGAAWLSEAPGAGFTVTYVYSNNPKSAAPSMLTPHDGTAIVTFDASGKGTGSYYTGRGRTNHGELTFEREKRVT